MPYSDQAMHPIFKHFKEKGIAQNVVTNQRVILFL